LIIQIETKEAIDNLESILEIPEVDVLYIGPNDLSISLGIFTPILVIIRHLFYPLGIPGQRDNPILLEAIDKVLVNYFVLITS
jgi:hypothetical protein